MRIIALSFFLFGIWCGIAATLAAQASDPRLRLNEAHRPFYHGVASGDPLPDRVVLWTRVTPDDTTASPSVRWRVATDTTFQTIVASGTASTSRTRDFCIHVDAQGLQPNTWYYYDFQGLGGRSVIGRTKTAPSGPVDQLRVAVLTCSDYKDGWFNAYARLGERNDYDAIFHLGDYIYESSSGPNNVRLVQPAVRLSTLEEYRLRYGFYRLDPDLQFVHQQYPMIATWDDHESSNDAWMYGAERVPDSATYVELARVSAQAYREWMPIRLPDSTQPERIYRQYRFGDLADFWVLDTRRIGRDKQAENANDPILQDSTRSMLGAAQRQWLYDGLRQSDATWQVLAQQVIMMPIRIPTLSFPFRNEIANTDQWDGYPFERARLLRHLDTANIRQVVVLTGDAHITFAGDVPRDESIYQPNTGQGVAAVEFVTPPIAANDGSISIPSGVVSTINPHVRYADFRYNGYTILTLTPSRAQADFYYVPTILTWDDGELYGESRYTDTGQVFLRSSTTPIAAQGSYPPLAPLADGYDPRLAPSRRADAQTPGSLLIGAYPNPARDAVVLSVAVRTPGPLTLELVDASGRVLQTRLLNPTEAGPHETTLDLRELPAGLYYARVAGTAGWGVAPVVRY